MIEFAFKPPGRHPRDPLDEQRVIMPVDLQELLAELDAFPCVARLSDLDVYDDTRIDGGWLAGLIEELERMGELLNANALELDIPQRVGVTCDEDIPTDFGRTGFIAWVNNLRDLAQRARSFGVPLLACGN